MKQRTPEEKLNIRRRIVAIASLLAFAGIALWITLLFRNVFAPHLESAEKFQAFLDSYGWKGYLILFALQCLQVVVALIPGELVELCAGYAYGMIGGTVVCMLGIALSSAIIFLLVKKIGIRMIELFFSQDKIHQLRFINNEKKLKRTVFLLFLIPGTPKDLLTYFVGLTEMTLSQFLIITMIARIPSLVSSTVSGQFVGDGDYWTAAIVYAITGAVSLIGFYIYNKILQRKEEKGSLI